MLGVMRADGDITLYLDCEEVRALGPTPLEGTVRNFHRLREKKPVRISINDSMRYVSTGAVVQQDNGLQIFLPGCAHQELLARQVYGVRYFGGFNGSKLTIFNLRNQNQEANYQRILKDIEWADNLTEEQAKKVYG